MPRLINFKEDEMAKINAKCESFHEHKNETYCIVKKSKKNYLANLTIVGEVIRK